MEDGQNNNARLSGIEIVLIMILAGIMDLLSLIPIVNVVIVPVGVLMFWFLFKLHGVDIGFGNPKRLLTIGGTSLAEIIPALSMIPAWVAGIGFTILLVRLEDKTGLTIPAAGTQKGGRSKIQKARKRLAQSPEKRREVLERAQRIRKIREARLSESSLNLQGIKTAPQES